MLAIARKKKVLSMLIIYGQYETSGNDKQKMEFERCPLCNRCLGDKNTSKHHLIPRSKGGKNSKKIWLHHICHQKIHSLFTEKELKHNFNTIEKLLENEEIIKFVKWVYNKDPSFYQSNKESKRKLIEKLFKNIS